MKYYTVKEINDRLDRNRKEITKKYLQNKTHIKELEESNDPIVLFLADVLRKQKNYWLSLGYDEQQKLLKLGWIAGFVVD